MSDRQDLLPADIRKKLPELYATDEQGDQAIVQVRFYTPDSNWAWYAIEFDGEDRFFGFVVGLETESGYFLLSELIDSCGPRGVPVERDKYFKPTTLARIRRYHRELDDQQSD